MLQSHHKSYAEKVPVSPLKKVTFYGPVMATKGENLHHVGAEVTPSKRTLFSTAQSSRGRHQSSHGISLNQRHFRSKSNEERPHVKTNVVGSQLKTRLNCNHTKLRCEACIASKKKSNKHRHRSLISDTPRQSHILPSTRNFPRGGTDGRKLYDCKDDNKSLSILDASWKPGQDTYAGREEGRSDSRSNAQEDLFGSRQSSEEGVRKKVQFADKIARNKKDKIDNHPNNANFADFHSKQNYHRRKDKLSQHKTNKSNPGNADTGNANHKSNYNSSGHHGYQSSLYLSERDNNSYNSTSTSDQEIDRLRGKEDICRLCESLRHHCLEHSLGNPRHLSSARDCPFQGMGRARTHSMPVQSSSNTKREEPCLLCRRYGKKHYYVDDEDCCQLCEAPYKYPFRNCEHRVPSSANNATRLTHHCQLTRPLHRQRSAPVFFSDGEDDTILRKNIPYEPKTDVVKDLKKKLEDEYMHWEYLRRKKHFHRRWRSWDAEDLKEVRNYRMHTCVDPWDYVPQHKCVHRYLQNDRLFLEPTITDEDGSSLCSECGAPQAIDPVVDPYLYHITLGGLKNNDRYGKENVDRSYRDLLPSKNKFHRSPHHHNMKPSKRLPGDTSKHIYAKLNRNINNILPLNSHYHLRPHITDELRYRVDPHTKRHPSKSMALIDHLI